MKNTILFMVDGSKSMSEEHWQEAIDTVTMISSMLSEDYETAMMVYSDEVNAYIDFEENMGAELEALQVSEQKGYTNTGYALETAMQKFSDKNEGQKRVLIISDGEISMKGEDATAEAVESYDAAVKKAAEQQIPVDVFLFESEKVEDKISYASEVTGGYQFFKEENVDFTQFVEQYLFQQLGQKRIMLGLSDSSDNVAEISLQDTSVERARILLTSESEIKDIQAFVQSSDLQIIQGKSFAVIDIKQPMEENVVLQYALEESGRLNAYLVKEYNFSVETEAIPKVEEAQCTIKVNIQDREGRSVLADADISKRIGIYLDGSRTEFEVEQGEAVITYPMEKIKKLDVKVDFTELNSRVTSVGEETSLLLGMPVLPKNQLTMKETPDNIGLYTVVSGLCVIFILLFVLYVRTQKKNAVRKVVEAAKSFEEVLMYDFSGQITIYVLKCPDMEDMPPTSVNLFARKSRESISFAWVMEQCGIRADIRDADQIQFSGGEEHTLCIKYNGEATLVKGKDILVRKKKHFLCYNEKILMIFNNGEIEIELHYKNIKPSER